MPISELGCLILSICQGKMLILFDRQLGHHWLSAGTHRAANMAQKPQNFQTLPRPKSFANLIYIVDPKLSRFKFVLCAITMMWPLIPIAALIIRSCPFEDNVSTTLPSLDPSTKNFKISVNFNYQNWHCCEPKWVTDRVDFFFAKKFQLDAKTEKTPDTGARRNSV